MKTERLVESGLGGVSGEMRSEGVGGKPKEATASLELAGGGEWVHRRPSTGRGSQGRAGELLDLGTRVWHE